MNDLISRKALIAEYDRVHIGEPGKARKLMEEAPTVDATPKWIPVRELMPKEDERVLVLYQDGVQRVMCPDCFGFPLVYTNDLKWVLATHWMPLPDPPKEGE